LAGARLTSHLRALLLLFGTYLPPPTSLSAAVNMPTSSRSTRVPLEVLSDTVLEEIKSRCSFVGEAMDTTLDSGVISPSGEDSMDLDLPPSDSAPSESDLSRSSVDRDSNAGAASSDFSIVSGSQVLPARSIRGEHKLQALANLYMRHSTATDLHLKVMPPVSQQTGTGHGTLVVPGWIRERGSEVLFEGGDVDESSVAETILDCLLKVEVLFMLRYPLTDFTEWRSRWTFARYSRHLFLLSVVQRCFPGLSRGCTQNSSELSFLRLPLLPGHPRFRVGPDHRSTTAMPRCAPWFLILPL